MPMNTSATLPRDPLARRRLGYLLTALVVLWPMLVIAEFNPRALFAPATLQVMGGFLAGFVPPALDAAFLGMLARATLETLAMATAGIALAFALAVPLSFLATQALSISRIGPGSGRARGQALRAVVRAVMAALRAIPELVWALV